MNSPTAAPAHFPYKHRTVEQVDRDGRRVRNHGLMMRKARRELRAALRAGV